MTIRISNEDVLAFARWSSDRNPLHVDPVAAQRTFFGQPIAHGMLSVLSALKASGAGPCTRIDVEFRGAVVPEHEYELDVARDAAGIAVTVRAGESALLIVRGGAASEPPVARARATLRTVPMRTDAAVRDLQDLEAGFEIAGTYETATDASLYASDSVLPLQARVLALCSYVIGMEVPGLRSLFTRATVSFFQPDRDSASLDYALRIVRFDRQFRMLDLELDVATPDGRPVARALLRAYVRFSPVLTDIGELQRRLPPEAASLRDKVAVVIGGTRGLGADVTAALAAAGCHVYATYHRDKDASEELATRLMAHGLTASFLEGDAGSSSWSSAAVDTLRARHGRIDLLVLNACAPPNAARIGDDDADAFDRYVSGNLRLARAPLTAFLPALRQSRGAVVTVSSSFVEEAPAGFTAYVALKQAVEGLARAASREYPEVAWLTPRPPRLQTAWNDTPTGVLGAIPSDRVASHIVHRLAGAWKPGSYEVLAEFPEFAAVAPSAPEEPQFTVVLACSFTADPVARGLRFWFDELKIPADVDVAPYGQILQTLLNPAAGAPKRGLNAVLLRVRDWLRELSPEQAASPGFVAEYLDKTARDFERAMRSHRARAAADTLLILCPSGSSDAPAIDGLVRQTGKWIHDAVSALPGLQVIAAENHHADYAVGSDDLTDPLREHIAHIPYRDAYLYVLSTLVARQAHRKISPVRKVVVVDCDNTLWRGVVGEVGAEGLEFDEAHRALHERLRALSASGVLVGLCSKNEEEDVWRVFETRQDLLLPREQVVAAAINWQPKSENLRRLAARLNLGLDSFVFLDDNPVECAEVRANCPDVLTLQWPTSPEEALRLLHHAWELQPGRGTAEDARRTEMYREEFKRQELLEGTLSFREFLDGLGLVVDVRPLDEADLKRAAQLTLRTNQFNFTTRRRDEAEMHALMSGARHTIRTIRVRDRFGDYGLVGLVIATPLSSEEAVLEVDTFLLSCRVLGRGVEHHLAAELGRVAVAAGLPAVRIRVEPTKRNTPARKFLEGIAPDEYRKRSDGVLECEFPAAWLAGLRFEPGDQPLDTYAEAETGPAAGPAVDSSRLRLRETQIARTARDLATSAGLVSAIDGNVSAAAAAAADATNAGSTILEAFSTALNLPTARIQQIDRLEALGCDSFKIVEITVALTQKFPWLPGTLLFEHRSVSEIVREVTELARKQAAPSPTAVIEAAPAARVASVESEIAVVGMHVRCAGARSPEELWRLLSDGASAVVPVPEDRRHFLHRLQDARPHWAGLLDEVDRFDAELFGVAPREAEIMDPQLRLFLEVAWGALEDAGCLGTEHDLSTGVFVGVMYGDYGFRANLASQERGTPYRCWEGFSLANRLSQLLGFRGPSLAVDTACSSSGTALHVAVRALAAGDCNVAVVGGVNLILDPDRFVHLGRLGILSHTGKCLAFGAEADGTVLGEGAGAVVLRRLSEARQRGDRILGVIKGTGVSTGSGTVGFTAPNPIAQSEAIKRALHAAGIDPRTISYVETHGTGTALGDPIEVRGLTLAHSSPDLIDPTLEGAAACGIGSIKPNIGHLEAGAGMLGLIKVLLQLQHGALLPSLTSEEPNPQIPFDQTPFYIQRTLTAWKRPLLTRGGTLTEMPRRAGLSSFGVGGSNAHVIVEEPPAPAASTGGVERPLHVLALSAHTRDGLRGRAANVAAWLEQTPDLSLADAFFSINAGRKHLQHRASVVVNAREAAIAQLREIANGRKASTTAHKPKIAFLFTGQGSQYAPMGRDLYETQPVFRDALDRCAAIFDTLLDRPLLRLLFADEGTDEALLLNQTGYTQPALFAFEYSLARLWMSWGVVPDVVMGHSVGEIAAMCVAGGVSLDDGLRLIAARGRLMQALPAGGAMTSVMADETRVRAAIAGHERDVSIAAINGPTQIVISGAGAVVAAIAERLTADGIKTRPLVVSHAFHSPLMKPIADEYAEVVRGIRFSVPRIPLVGAVHGRLAGDEVARAEYWMDNALEAVRFADGIRAVEAAGVNAYLEMGPQPVLVGMGRQCVSDDTNALWLASLRKDKDAWTTMLGSLSELYGAGAEIDWKAFDSPYARRRATAPAYPFGGRRFWISAGPAERPVSGPARAESDSPSTEAGVAAAAYEIAWREAPSLLPAAAARGDWMILADSGGFGALLVGALEDLGGRCTVVFAGDRFVDAGRGRYQVNPESAADLARIMNMGRELRGIVNLWPLDNAAGTAADAHRAIERALLVAQQAVGRTNGAARLWMLTKSAVPAGEPAAISLSQAPLWGFARTVALEHPEAWGGVIDLGAEPGPADAAAVLAELVGAADEDQVAIRNSRRYVPRLVAAPEQSVPDLRFNSDEIYVITGGFGAIGRRVAQWTVSRGARHLVLTSRRGEDTPGAREVIRDLETRGATVRAMSADVANEADVARTFDAIAESGRSLGGVFHVAGNDLQLPLIDLNHGRMRPVLEPKIDGAWLLHERSRGAQFVCFSSISSVLGAAGRSAYAAANAFLDGLAHERRRLGLHGLTINWGPWSGGGIASPDVLEQFERIGNHGLDPDQALRLLEIAIQSSRAQVSVARIDWSKFKTVYEARGPKPLLSELQTAEDAARTSETATQLPEWMSTLSAAPVAQRERALAALLQREVADTLGFEGPDSVPLDRTFQDMGMDSLMSAEFARRLNKQLGIRSTSLVFQHPSAGALAHALIDQVNAAAVAASSTAVSAQAVALSATAADRAAVAVAHGGNPIAGYSPDTEPLVFAFHRQAWPNRSEALVEPRWRWMFVDSARRLGLEPRVWLYRDNGRVVGHNGAIPVRLKVGQHELDTAWLVDTMVLEEFRSQAVGSRLMLESDQDLPFALSLGQTSQMREIQLRLGWEQVAPLHTAQLLIRPDRVLKGKLPAPAAAAAGLGLRAAFAVRDAFRSRPRLAVREVPRFDHTHDALWSRMAATVTCVVKRDASYLNWKYVDQPGQQFLRLEVLDGGVVRAVAVWALREPDRVYAYRRALLVDVVAPLDNAGELAEAIGATIPAVADRGADAALCLHINETLTRALRECGFYLREPGRFLLVSPGPLEGSTRASVLSASSWYVTQGDSDIDRPW